MFSTLEVSKRVGVPLVVATRSADTKGWISAHLTDSALSFCGAIMPQKFLSIKNFEKYQTSCKYPKPWIKLYKSVLNDPEFMKLSTPYRFLYLGLLILADETGNKIWNDADYLVQRLHIPRTDAVHLLYKSCTDGVQTPYKYRTKLDLTPLYRAGFLIASNVRRCVQELEKSREELEIEKDSLTERANGHGKTSLPDEWQLTEEMITGWRKLGLNPHIEFASFKDHARTHDRRCKDWDAAFRNWCRKSIAQKEKRS